MNKNELQKNTSSSATFSDRLLQDKFKNLPQETQSALAELAAEKEIELGSRIKNDMVTNRNADINTERHIETAKRIQQDRFTKGTDKTISEIKTSSGNMRIESKSGYCYVATATYQNINNPNVIILRDFRDRYLSQSLYGRVFIKFYYLIGEYIAFFPNKIPAIRKVSKVIIDKIVYRIINHYYFKQ